MNIQQPLTSSHLQYSIQCLAGGKDISWGCCKHLLCPFTYEGTFMHFLLLLKYTVYLSLSIVPLALSLFINVEQ